MTASPSTRQTRAHQIDMVLDFSKGEYYVNEASSNGYILERCLARPAPPARNAVRQADGLGGADPLRRLVHPRRHRHQHTLRQPLGRRLRHHTLPPQRRAQANSRQLRLRLRVRERPGAVPLLHRSLPLGRSSSRAPTSSCISGWRDPGSSWSSSTSSGYYA